MLIGAVCPLSGYLYALRTDTFTSIIIVGRAQSSLFSRYTKYYVYEAQLSRLDTCHVAN
jgi:hypothetical protein